MAKWRRFRVLPVCQVYLIPDLFVNEMALIGIFNKVHDVLETRIDASMIYVLSISLAN
jgi:hypothetical protein